MTSCRDVDRLATAYIDGELDDRRSSAVRGHLRVCESCAERVEDEARVRELCSGLDPVDPPSAMWKAIDARLADAEIGDSRRSALWLFLQRSLDGARRNALALGVCAAGAAVLLIVWLPGGGEEQTASPEAAVAPADRAEPQQGEGPACAGARSHEELVLCQSHASDRRYLDAIAELKGAVADERTSWTPADAARFDASLAELDRAAQLERVRLAGQPPATPASRDPLYSIYRAQIDLLSSAVVAGDLAFASNPIDSPDPTEAAPRRGRP
ncbi:MAG TPA: zf-HC2 domain-containing protein [Kofleriaceae bacterium]|nr:zf-HC2 domain-containing protein [Kofleriaceae bacterium]